MGSFHTADIRCVIGLDVTLVLVFGRCELMYMLCAMFIVGDES